mmetsp:Transcript_4018/g.3425  ORF Transcript_4018/g.3425 Transcript_4018/m.3425 type:complete len:101 (-) Transcript_4018:391-693(-)
MTDLCQHDSFDIDSLKFYRSRTWNPKSLKAVQKEIEDQLENLKIERAPADRHDAEEFINLDDIQTKTLISYNRRSVGGCSQSLPIPSESENFSGLKMVKF